MAEPSDGQQARETLRLMRNYPLGATDDLLRLLEGLIRAVRADERAKGEAKTGERGVVRELADIVKRLRSEAAVFRAHATLRRQSARVWRGMTDESEREAAKLSKAMGVRSARTTQAERSRSAEKDERIATRHDADASERESEANTIEQLHAAGVREGLRQAADMLHARYRAPGHPGLSHHESGLLAELAAALERLAQEKGGQG